MLRVQRLRFLLRKALTELAFFVTASMCVLKLSFESRWTPRYLPESTTSRTCSRIEYVGGIGDCLLVKLMTWHFEGLNSISHLCSQMSKASRSCCSLLLSRRDVIRLYSTQSSAKSLVVECLTQDGRSLMYIRNSSGPKTLPWGTPEVTEATLLTHPSTMTCCVRSCRKSWIQLRAFPRMP